MQKCVLSLAPYENQKCPQLQANFILLQGELKDILSDKGVRGLREG